MTQNATMTVMSLQGECARASEQSSLIKKLNDQVIDVLKTKPMDLFRACCIIFSPSDKRSTSDRHEDQATGAIVHDSEEFGECDAGVDCGHEKSAASSQSERNDTASRIPRIRDLDDSADRARKFRLIPIV